MSSAEETGGDGAVSHSLPNKKSIHARFFGFVPSSPTWPGVLADFMIARYNINA